MKFLRRLLLLMGGIVLSYVFVRGIVWQLPGSVADILSDSETNLQDLQAMSDEFSRQTSFWSPLRDFFTFDWGESQSHAEANLPIIWKNFRYTLRLSVLSLVFTALISLSYFALNRKLSFRVSSLFLAMPGIAIYPAVIFFACTWTSFCPAGSTFYWKALFMAAIVQGFLAAPRFYREIEWELEEVRRQRFVLVLRAKGLDTFKIWSRHIALNILGPFLSLLLLTALGFFSGAILVEALFDLPGLGLLLLEALRARDLPLIFPLVMFLSLLHLITLQSGRLLRTRRIEYE